MERWVMKRSLEPIESLVESGALKPDIALSMLTKQFQNFSEDSHTTEFRKFKANSGLIYRDEVFSDTSYVDDCGGTYIFRPPSHIGVLNLYKLHQHLSGGEFDSPESLMEIMQGLLKGKRVLEIGSGPGFNLNVLKKLGAEVSGVELRRELVGKLPEIDVKVGDAANLDKMFGKELFDIIYSTDFFCKAVIDEQKATEIAYRMGSQTRAGGISIHQMSYEKMALPVFLFSMWLSNRQVGRDHKTMEDWFWNEPKWSRNDMLYTNRSTLDLQDLLRGGFGLKEYSIENGDLNIVVKRPS